MNQSDVESPREPEEPEPTVEEIIVSIHSGDKEERTDAVVRAISLDDERLIGVLALALGDQEETVRAPAALAFAKYDKPGITDSLVKLLDDESDHVRDFATMALADRDWDEAKRWVISMLGDPALNVRGTAIRCIAQNGNTDELKMLVDRDQSIACNTERRLIALALAERSGSVVAEYMSRAVENKDLTVIAGGYNYFLRHREVMPTALLAQALDCQERSPVSSVMAARFMSSGVDDLVAAAERYNSKP